MARASYQYGTSPRKYEPDYTARKKTSKSTAKKAVKTTGSPNKINKKQEDKKSTKKQKAKKVQERKSKILQIGGVLAAFVMLLILSYREISIMEMFNQKKGLENHLSVVEKENGQVEKSIKEVESTFDWNSIQQKATEQLGMQKKAGTPVELDKLDNVETSTKLIKKENTNIIEKIISFFVNK